MCKQEKYVYFASDFHLGIPTHKESLIREKKIVAWLNTIQNNIQALYLVGDLFDFWFEYKTVVPRGYTRLFGKLTEFTDNGIPVHFFKGNHDVWAFNYFEEELGFIMHRKPEIHQFADKKFYIAHGDGLGRGDLGYKFLKRLFECPINQFLFKWLHPDLGIRMALFWSRKSRYANITKELDKEFIPEKERLFQYATNVIETQSEIDYFIFGHRHIPVKIPITKKTTYLNLGDWISNFSYAVFDGKSLQLKYWQ